MDAQSYPGTVAFKRRARSQVRPRFDPSALAARQALPHLALDVQPDGRKAVSSKRVTAYELEQRSDDDSRIVVLAVTGELDLTNAHEFEERVAGVVPSDGASLVLDLTRVSFIDSAALHVLFRTAGGLTKDRFGLLLEAASAISRTLEIVCISDVATVGRSLDDLSSALSP
jgi:anti-anti-sigma factor